MLVIGVIVISRGRAEPVTLPIRIEEYSDFQCPACISFYPSVKQVTTEFGQDKILFEYKHFPLEQLHPRAFPAAVASEAAREQGKFDEFHDKLFEGKGKLEDDDFYKYAEELNLDLAKFKEDYSNNQDLKQRVLDSIDEGKNRGVNATPTFFINGKKFSPTSLDALYNKVKGLIEQAQLDAQI